MVSLFCSRDAVVLPGKENVGELVLLSERVLSRHAAHFSLDITLQRDLTCPSQEVRIPCSLFFALYARYP